MAGGVFLPALGRVRDLHNNVANNTPSGAGLVCVLLKLAEVDADLEQYATLDLLLAESGNEECDAVGYVRQVLLSADVNTVSTDLIEVPPTVNATAEANFEFGVMGDGTGNPNDNDIVKALVCYAPDPNGADSTFQLLTHHDFVVTTNGVLDITAKIPTAGYWLARNEV